MDTRGNLSAEEKIRIVRESSDAFHHHIDAFSICFLDKHDGYRPARGTLIRISQRLLVITAAHVIPDYPHERLFFLGSIPRAESEELKILNFGKLSGERPDVGFFEFDPVEALSFFGKKACGLERLSVTPKLSSNRLLAISGCPSDPKVFRVDRDRKRMKALSILVIINALELDEVSVPSASPNPDAAIDVFLDYSENCTNDMKTWESVDLPTPFGYSGSGVWDYGFDQGLWTPEQAKLIAIQSTWYEKNRYLRGVLVDHWLRLIHREYPDLRSILEEQFPQLSQ